MHSNTATKPYAATNPPEGEATASPKQRDNRDIKQKIINDVVFSLEMHRDFLELPFREVRRNEMHLFALVFLQYP